MNNKESFYKAAVLAYESIEMQKAIMINNGNRIEWSTIAILTVTSPIVINVPTRGLLAVETKDSFVLWLAKFKYQKNCL